MGDEQGILSLVNIRTPKLGVTVEDIARVAHEANRALQTIQDNPTIPVSDDWDSLSEHYKNATIEGVVNALEGMSPEQLHDRWCSNKLKAGWIFGNVKDEVKKTHPLLISYSKLSDADKLKDHLFQGVVKSMSM